MIENSSLEHEPALDCRVHYDTDPRVFELMLDRNMNYSSGYYQNGDENLDAAQIHKMQKIAALCRMSPGKRLLDIGCGWSGPLMYFAKEYGVDSHGLTVSPVQRDWAIRTAQRRGLEARVHVEVCDVLECAYEEHSFDHIIFLESIIHMPEKAAIFALCHKLLKPGGILFVQESCYDKNSLTHKYRGERGFQAVDRAFGDTGAMVSGGEMLRLMEEAGLLPIFLENISNHYKRTLAQWAQNLDLHKTELKRAAGPFFNEFRRYIMLAIATYQSEQTLCHMMAAQKTPNSWSAIRIG